MKAKLIFVLCILMISGNMVKAQKLLIKGGANWSDMAVSGVAVPHQEFSGYEPGYHIGLYNLKELGRVIGIESGLQFSKNNYSFSHTESGVTQDARYEAYNLSIPVNLRLSLGLGGLFRIYGTGGFYGGMGVGGKKSMDDYREKISWGSGSGDDLNRWDYGYNVGIGCQVTWFELGLNYRHGLNNLTNIEATGYEQNSRLLELTMAVRLEKGKK